MPDDERAEDEAQSESESQSDSESDSKSQSESSDGSKDGSEDEPVPDLDDIEKPDVPSYGEDESQSYVDRDAIDFDPEEGLYSGTAVKGGETEIPDPPTDDAVQAALDDIKSGGTGIIEENKDKTQPKDGAESKDESSDDKSSDDKSSGDDEDGPDDDGSDDDGSDDKTDD